MLCIPLKSWFGSPRYFLTGCHLTLSFLLPRDLRLELTVSAQHLTMRWALVVVLICLCGIASANFSPEFQNELMRPLDVMCYDGDAFFEVHSNFVTSYVMAAVNDRQWRWDCRKISSFRKGECDAFQTIIVAGDSNDDETLFQCPKNEYIGAISSNYDPTSMERTWEVKCCRLCDYCAHDCHLNPEGYINSAGNYMSYTADDKAVFVGLFTDLDDVSRDRRWRIMQCRFSLCDYDTLKGEDDSD